MRPFPQLDAGSRLSYLAGIVEAHFPFLFREKCHGYPEGHRC